MCMWLLSHKSFFLSATLYNDPSKLYPAMIRLKLTKSSLMAVFSKSPSLKTLIIGYKSLNVLKKPEGNKRISSSEWSLITASDLRLKSSCRRVTSPELHNCSLMRAKSRAECWSLSPDDLSSVSLSLSLYGRKLGTTPARFTCRPRLDRQRSSASDSCGFPSRIHKIVILLQIIQERNKQPKTNSLFH